MSDGMRRELAYLSSHATNRYFIPNWGNNSIVPRIIGQVVNKLCHVEHFLNTAKKSNTPRKLRDVLSFFHSVKPCADSQKIQL